MKNIIVGGVSRAGKSTVAQKVAEKLGYHWISLDPMVDAFGKTFPDLNIRHTNLDHKDICSNFSQYLNNYLEALQVESDESGQGFIIESMHIKPSLLSKAVLSNFQMCFIGFPNIGVEEKFDQIRKYDVNDWTLNESDEKLRYFIGDQFIPESRMYQEECERFELPYFDVSFDFKDTQEQIIHYLVKNSI